jgi:hypothetical protein
MTTVKIKRSLVRDLVEMVRAEGADDAIVTRPSKFGWDPPPWGVTFPHLEHVLEFFTAMGVMTDADLDESNELALTVEDASEVARRATVTLNAAGGFVTVWFSGVELVGEGERGVDDPQLLLPLRREVVPSDGR